MKVPDTCPRVDHHLVLHRSDLCAEERAWINTGAAPFDANGVRNGRLLLLCNCGPQNGSVLFLWALLCLSALSCCVDINVFPSPSSFSLLPPLLFLGRCCRAYWRSIAVSYQTGTQVRAEQMSPSPLNTPVTRTHAHTHSAAPVIGNNQWVVMLGNGCSVGGFTFVSLSVFLYALNICKIRPRLLAICTLPD